MNVEIWSDVVCPWCYLGKRRFEAALAAFDHRDLVNVRWRSFELDPSAPRTREVDLTTYLADKLAMSHEQAEAMHNNMTGLAAGEGIQMRFDIARSGNTFDAHRLLQLAVSNGSQEQLKERLMSAYFTEGEAIGEQEVLRRLAVQAGLPADEVDEVLQGDRYTTEVRHDERTAEMLGISGVPFFVIDRSLGASGAQSPEILGELLRRAWDAAPQPAATS